MKAVQTCEVETPLALHGIGHIFYSDRSLIIIRSHEVTFIRKKQNNSLRIVNYFFFFNVLLTVHLSIIIGNDQLDAKLLDFTIYQYIYDVPLHVSSIICSSSGG